MKSPNDNNPSERDASTPTARKPYVKPAFRLERVFETRALVCGKINGTQQQCIGNVRAS